jgi:2-keto-4-pentenoate hydratase
MNVPTNTSPVKLALWIAVAGISFGVALNAGWLIVSGMTLPLLVLGGFVVHSLLH